MAEETERHLVVSPRERQLVLLLAMGKSEAECATDMEVKISTVKNTANTLRYKLGVRTRREIPMAYWRQTGDDPFPKEDA